LNVEERARLKSELDSRFASLTKWLNKNETEYAVVLKEEGEVYSGNYQYYGGGFASGEYGAIIVDSSGSRSAIAHEYSAERIRESGFYSRVYEIRQSIEELVSTLRGIVGNSSTALDASATKNVTDLFRSSSPKVPSKSLREFVFSQRAIKTAFEIQEMERAIGIAKKALARTVENLQSGVSTEQISRSLNKNLLDGAAIGPSFETDVRIRRNLNEDEVQKLRRGDLILVDFGAKLSSGYLSDVGRTIPFDSSGNQKINDFLEKVYSIKRAGLKKIVSGKTGSQVRDEIDQVIREHGFDSTHRPGHQIGLNVHEPFGPALAYGKENSGLLQEGNVVTWEPGIGLVKNRDKLNVNRFGMSHMEDMVLVGSPSRVLGNFKLEVF
jgi:Xaa-Pro aminopeptidase